MLCFNKFYLVLQLGTLGAGNHYAEVQVVDEIYNEFNARKMGIEHTGQVLCHDSLWQSRTWTPGCNRYNNIQIRSFLD